MEQARVNIIEPNGVRRSLALENRPLLIGRDPECDISIGYDRASRHHAKIMFDGYRYYVIDLGSTNGTFLGKTQLEPDTPTEWTPDTPVRIGDIYFHLEVPKTMEAEEERIRATETIAGYAPQPNSDSGGPNRLLLAAVAGIGLLCGCLGLGAIGYAIYIN